MDAKTTDKDGQMRKMAVELIESLLYSAKKDGYTCCLLADGRTRIALDEVKTVLLYCITTRLPEAQRRKEYRAQKRNMLVQIMKDIREIKAMLEHCSTLDGSHMHE